MTPVPGAGLGTRLSEFVAERLPGATLTPLSGDASTRRYYRASRGGESWVLALHGDPFELGTLTFSVVRGLLARFGLPVPAIVEADGARGILLLEDLGDLTLQEALRTADPQQRWELYSLALVQLARLQREAALGAQAVECFRVAFDVEKLSWELHYFEKHFLEGLRGCELTVQDRATLAKAFHGLAREIGSWPRVLCHRDFHSRNLMLHRGTLYWIDFQDARMGHASYDLASLLRDSYVELPEDLVAALAEEFRRRASTEPAEQFQRRFELMCVQRNLKALGTFGYMTTVRGTSVYLPYIPGTLRSVRRNLMRHPQLAELHGVLARHLDELR